jgi:aerobactin synthase
LSESEKEKLGKILEEKKISLESFLLIPVHPWQWNRFLQTQFAGELAEGVLHFLGAFGDFYQPQISLRTLSNVSRRGNLDIKLPLTLLNTSSIRGIPERYIAPGPALSQALSEICRKDAFLAEKNVQILEEKAGLSYVQADFKKIPEAPYRYHEFLGVIWREAAESKIQNQEKAILAGSLSYRHNGKSLLGAYAKQAGVSLPIWLRDYFQHVVLPLYHLQLAHGIGLVSHGQNITVKLREGRPCGLLLKDFQGDLRLSESSPWKDLPAFSGLTKLPPAYLIHDLYTGHFVTVLRYVSETLQECDGFSESDFYAILAECIGDYLSTRSSQKNIHDEVNLLAQKMPRVVVNRVRFKIGYADAAARPLPLLGDDLKNPLYRGEK